MVHGAVRSWGGFQPSLGGGCSGVRKQRAECCLLILFPAVLRGLSVLTLCCLLLRAQLDLGLVASFFSGGETEARSCAAIHSPGAEPELPTQHSRAGAGGNTPFISRENSFK